MQIGDKIKWRSSNEDKEGVIVAVVPAGSDPYTAAKPLGTAYGSLLYGGGQNRSHESYLVAVETKGTRSKPKLYWPRVSLLRGTT